MNNFSEKSPERIPSKDEVMGVIARFMEGAEVIREEQDEQGNLLYLEAKITDPTDGEPILFCYTSKGIGPNRTDKISSVSVAYHIGGVPVSGFNIADFDHETGQWTDVR